jgi:hypothetical protein
MALWFSFIAVVWSCWLDWLAYMVSIIVRDDFSVSIVGPIAAIIWGMRASSRFRSGRRFWKSSVMVSTPSSASKVDRNDQQIGML